MILRLLGNERGLPVFWAAGLVSIGGSWLWSVTPLTLYNRARVVNALDSAVWPGCRAAGNP